MCVCVCVCEGLRGIGAELVILEEAAYIDQVIFSKIIVPLMAVANTAVFGITTADGGHGNYYNKLLLSRKPDGQSMFKCIHVKLICAECKARDPENKRACPHYRHLLPPWKDDEDNEKLGMLVDAKTHAEENMGELELGTDCVLSGDTVERFFRSPPIDVIDIPKMIFVTMDPSAGGVAADFAITTSIRYANDFHVVS